jgi:hypothetical protein
VGGSRSLRERCELAAPLPAFPFCTIPAHTVTHALPRTHRRAEAFHRLPHLRATLDKLLVNRPSDVELLPCGGPGVAMLAASYTAERGLPITAHVPEFGRYPERAAIDRRDGELVAMADAAVIVWEERNPDVLRLLELVKAKGIPIHIIGGNDQ